MFLHRNTSFKNISQFLKNFINYCFSKMNKVIIFPKFASNFSLFTWNFSKICFELFEVDFFLNKLFALNSYFLKFVPDFPIYLKSVKIFPKSDKTFTKKTIKNAFKIQKCSLYKCAVKFLKCFIRKFAS